LKKAVGQFDTPPPPPPENTWRWAFMDANTANNARRFLNSFKTKIGFYSDKINVPINVLNMAILQ